MRPFDFAYFEELYDLRIVLEQEAVKRLCEWPAGVEVQLCVEILDIDRESYTKTAIGR